MDDARFGRGVRVLRQRRGWRQIDLGGRAGVSDSTISAIERGRVGRFSLAALRRVTRALDADTDLLLRWGGIGDVDRLLDRDHATLVQAWAELHKRHGWEIWPEASYSIYGERGRIDLLAWHPATRTLEVAEMKTGIWDVQDTLGKVDTKVRLGPQLARERRWEANHVVGALVIADGRTARRRLAEHATLFARYAVRGRTAIAFIRDPQPVSGLFALITLPRRRDRRRAGQQRVRA